MSLVSYYLDSGAGVITLEDGDNGNVLNPESLGSLAKAFSHLNENHEARFIVIRSRGENFCLGMDLNRVANAGQIDGLQNIVGVYADLLYAMYTSSKSLVALIDGPVKAGGVGIAAACDIVLASENASFELSEALFGLIPANVLPYLFSLRVSPQKARYLVLSAARIDARNAMNIGLVDEVFPRGSFETEARKVFRRLCRISPAAVGEYKKFTSRMLDLPFEQRKEEALHKLLELMKSEETLKAIQNFNEGLTPSWFSKFKPQKNIVCSEED